MTARRSRTPKYQPDQANPQLPYPGLVDQVQQESSPPAAKGHAAAPQEGGEAPNGHGLFDLDPSEYTFSYHQFEAARIGDRMLLALGLDVTPTAKVVATCIAYYARKWTGYPSRETISANTNIKPQHVSRALRELEKAGIIERRISYGSRGKVVFETTFQGAAIVETAALQEHPELGHHAKDLLARGNHIGSGGVEISPEKEGRGNHIGSGASVRENQYGTRTGEPGVTVIDLSDGSVKTDQSIVPPGSGNQNGSREPEDPATLPTWYQAMTDLADPERFPRYADIAADADAHGWDAVVLEEAAERYRGHYGVQTHYDQPAPRISDPLALFRKLAEDVVQHLVRVGPLPPAPRQEKEWL